MAAEVRRFITGAMDWRSFPVVFHRLNEFQNPDMGMHLGPMSYPLPSPDNGEDPERHFWE